MNQTVMVNGAGTRVTAKRAAHRNDDVSPESAHERPELLREGGVRSEVVVVTVALVNSWERPDFQRMFKQTKNVVDATNQIGRTEEIPGTIWIGVWEGRSYVVDGQHRIEAFLGANIAEALASVAFKAFDSYDAMARFYRMINTPLRSFSAQDNLKAAAVEYESLRIIEREATFASWYKPKRNSGKTIQISSMVRFWGMARSDAPGGSAQVVAVAAGMNKLAAHRLCVFGSLCHDAWGTDSGYAALWGGLNFPVVLWLYARTVLRDPEPSLRVTRLDQPAFKKALVSLCDESYVDWLRGRNSLQNFRSPCYNKIKQRFKATLEKRGERLTLPSPDWASNNAVPA